MYEGYAPGGVALMVDVLSDNRNRTGAEIRNIFSKLGGSMAEPGAVSWQFSRRGVILVAGTVAEDDVMMAALEAGADDISVRVTSGRCSPIPARSTTSRPPWRPPASRSSAAESTMISSMSVEVTDADDARKILRIMDALEDNDDVQDVYSNFDIAESLMEQVG